MGVVRAAGPQAGVAQLPPQLGLGEDAHVSARDERGVVLLGQRPADLLGEPRRHGDGDPCRRA